MDSYRICLQVPALERWRQGDSRDFPVSLAKAVRTRFCKRPVFEISNWKQPPNVNLWHTNTYTHVYRQTQKTQKNTINRWRNK